MPARLGKQALVIGVGIAGFAAARALADFFAHVIILENGAVSKQAIRAPQGNALSILWILCAFLALCSKSPHKTLRSIDCSLKCSVSSSHAPRCVLGFP